MRMMIVDGNRAQLEMAISLLSNSNYSVSTPLSMPAKARSLGNRHRALFQA